MSVNNKKSTPITKKDLRLLQTNLGNQIQGVRNNLENQINGVRTDLQNQMQETKKEILVQMDEKFSLFAHKYIMPLHTDVTHLKKKDMKDVKKGQERHGIQITALEDKARIRP